MSNTIERAALESADNGIIPEMGSDLEGASDALVECRPPLLYWSDERGPYYLTDAGRERLATLREEDSGEG